MSLPPTLSLSFLPSLSLYIQWDHTQTHNIYAHTHTGQRTAPFHQKMVSLPC